MASIGPQLPPSLTKRKRDSDNEEDGNAPGSPPTKVHATKQSRVGNDNEISLDDGNSSSDDDDGFGPSAAAPAPAPAPRPAASHPKSKPSIGPTLPSSAAAPPAANTDEITLDSDDDDDDDGVGPAPVTAPRPAPSASASAAAPAPAPTKRVHGPAAPPAPLSEKPNNDPSASDDTSDDDDDDDDDYGPALPTSTSHKQRHLQAERRGVFSTQNNTAGTSKPKRDDWMLAPPSAGSGPRAPDPTKLKSRGFATGPRAGNSGGKGDGEISSIWTETPEEKRRRLENAVLGRGDGGSGSNGGGASSSQRRTKTVTTTTMMSGNGSSNGNKDEEGQQDRIREYTESTRGRSLYEEHQLGKKTAKDDPKKGKGRKGGEGEEEEEEEDDPSKRAFDKEKDMKLGGRIGTAQRRELLTRAADFGGRFAKGKYL